MANGLCDMNEFDVDDYEYYEKVENGDWNWVTPNFIAFASPVEPLWSRKEKEKRSQDNAGGPSSPVKTELALQRKLPPPFQNCLDYFEKRNVKLVVRLNNPLYDRQHFLDHGINHTELYFDDGTNPTDDIVRAFIEMADEVVEAGGVVAVHVSSFVPLNACLDVTPCIINTQCKAGLGRTGTLIGAYLTWKYGFTAPEAIAFMRIVRPGSVVGPQQQYMYTKHMEWARWGAVDDFKKQQGATAVISRTEIVAPITPPMDSDSDQDVTEGVRAVAIVSTSMDVDQPVLPTTPPQVAVVPATPHRPVVVLGGTIMPTPGQPRKTPATKRHSDVLDSDAEDSDDEAADVLPALNVAPLAARKIRPKPVSSRPIGARVTASEQRPMRVTRSTAAAAANARKGTGTGAAVAGAGVAVTRAQSRASGSVHANGNANGQPASKVPRLANGTSVRSTTNAVFETNGVANGNGAAPASPAKRLRRPVSPIPSRLPTLVSAKKPAQNENTNGTAAALKAKAAGSGDWVSTNAAAVVVPRSKTSSRPVLRPTRKRRSSFSAADVVA